MIGQAATEEGRRAVGQMGIMVQRKSKKGGAQTETETWWDEAEAQAQDEEVHRTSSEKAGSNAPGKKVAAVRL